MKLTRIMIRPLIILIASWLTFFTIQPAYALREQLSPTKILKIMETHPTKIIGDGEFGLVFLTTVDSEKYAVKAMRQDFDSNQSRITCELSFHNEGKLNQEVARKLDTATLSAEETELLDQLVLPIGYQENQQRRILIEPYIDGSEFFLAMDFLSPKQRIDLMIQLTKELNLLHKLGFVHLDLKPENTIISFPVEPCGKPQLFLIDFGLVKKINEPRLNTCGNCRYSAPEIITAPTYFEQMDTYPLARMIPEFLFGSGADDIFVDFYLNNAFVGEGFNCELSNQEYLYQHLLTANASLKRFKNEQFLQDVAKLMAEMLQIEPTDRPPLDQVIFRLEALKDEI